MTLAPSSRRGLDGRQSSLDSTVIGDGGAVQRNIEISANQNALALEISKVLECLHEYPFLDESHVKVANFATLHITGILNKTPHSSTD